MENNSNVVFVYLTTIASSVAAITGFTNGSRTMDHVLWKESERQALLILKLDLTDFLAVASCVKVIAAAGPVLLAMTSPVESLSSILAIPMTLILKLM